MGKLWHSTAPAAVSLRKWLAMGMILIVAAVLAAGCATQFEGRTTPATAPDVDPAQDAARDSLMPHGLGLSTQRNDAGRVETDVTPLSLRGDVWEFEIGLNTHSVDLGFDLTKVSALRCDQRQEFEAVAWDGSGPGGHHRTGVLRFAALDHPTSFVEIVVRDVAAVPERVFGWELPEATEPRADGDVAQSATSEAPSPADDGPAAVASSIRSSILGQSQ